MSKSDIRIRGESGIAQTVREKDWSQTIVGNVDDWTADLLNAVNLIMAAPIPMQLFWGPDFICIYNDAIAPALSSKHPGALGMPAREVWAEVWDTIGPQMEAVLTTGQSVRFDDVPLSLLRDGVLDDQFWTYSYSPIFDANGAIVGVLDVAQDSTSAVLAKRELARNAEVMRRSEERFRLLVDRASVGINIGDSTGELSYVNAALLKQIGYTAQEVAEGKVRWDDMTPLQYAVADSNALLELKQTGVAAPYEKVAAQRTVVSYPSRSVRP